MNYECPICMNYLKKITDCKDKYAYYECKKCSLVTSKPFPTDEEINSYYQGFLFKKPENDFYSLKINNIGKDVDNIVKQINLFRQFDKTASLLDFGGGVGFYSNSFQKHYNTYYYEIDNKAKDYVKTQFPNIKVVDDIFLCSLKFDIIFCNNVIEHVKEPKKFVNQLKNLLAQDGLLILITPNQKCKEFYFRLSWFNQYLKYGKYNIFAFLRKPWITCDPPRHIHSFNRKSYEILADLCGLKVINIFSEYSTEQIYSEKFRITKIKTVRTFIKNVSILFLKFGISFIKLFDKNKDYGNLLIGIFKTKTND